MKRQHPRGRDGSLEPSASRAHSLALYAQAHHAAQRGQAREAAALLRRSIKTDPHFAPAIDALIFVCTQRRWRDELLAGMQDAYDGGSRDTVVLEQLVLLCFGTRRYAEAAVYLDALRAHFPRRRKLGTFAITTLRDELARLQDTPNARPLRPGLVRAEPGRRITPPSSWTVKEPTTRPHPVGTRPSAQTAPADPSGRKAEKPAVRARQTTGQAPAEVTAPREHLPRPSLAPITITVHVEEPAFVRRVERREVNDLRRHRLCLAAHRLAILNSVDELLCLSALHGVEKLWHQIETVRKVLRRFRGRALLCDEVGLGKTVEAGMIIREYLLRGLVRSVLILVPPALVGQWQEEMRSKFELLFATTADPRLRKDPDAFWADENLCIASLSLAKSKRMFSRVASREFDLIVVDEAHHLKNRTTQAWKLVDSLKSRFLLLLTATPVHNNLLELHNLITLLKPGQLETRAAFVRRFVSKEDPTRPVNEGQLRELLSEVMVRNTRALAGLKLPPRRATTIRVESGPEERALYERLSALVRREFTRGDAGLGQDRLTLRLLQSEAGSCPRALLRTLGRIMETRRDGDSLRLEVENLADAASSIRTSAKVEALLPLLANGGEQTIVFVSFRETLAFLASELRRRGLRAELFHGGLSTAEKDTAVARFQDGTPVLLTTEVGGEGRNLQFCHRMVNFDLPWNPMRIEQRIGRIHRIGQERITEIWNLCAQGSVEDYLLEILDRKINLFELVVGEVDMILGQMTDRRDFGDRLLDAWASASSDAEAAENFDRLSEEMVRAKSSYERAKSLDSALFGEDYEA